MTDAFVLNCVSGVIVEVGSFGDAFVSGSREKLPISLSEVLNA